MPQSSAIKTCPSSTATTHKFIIQLKTNRSLRKPWLKQTLNWSG
ncbi:hypothetical protein [Candidatus Hecatella orcuttiae]|nr:hypothetical protein [Candidatus Hecatella orcuttiae]